MSNRFIILDRDGTAIVDKHYLDNPDGVELLPGAVQGLRKMIDAGYSLIFVSNQSGIGRGLFDVATLDAINQRMTNILEQEGISHKGIYYCPHTPEENCSCRKPRTALVINAIAEHGFQPEESWVIGDKAADINLGKAVNARSILVLTGKGTKTNEENLVSADYEANNLTDAADFIIQTDNK